MREALGSLPWVRKATVDYGKKQATLTVEEGRYDPREAFAALKKAGFGGEALETSEGHKDARESFPEVSFHVIGLKKARSGAT